MKQSLLILLLLLFIGAKVLGYEVVANESIGLSDDSNELAFSHDEGFYTSAFTLNINSLLGHTIYYTLNGDIPTTASTVFNDPLVISSKDSSPNVFSNIPTTPVQNLISYKAWEVPEGNIDKATILRCASYENGILTSDIYTKTFFVDEEIFDKYTVPVLSIVTEGANLFSEDYGIYVAGVHCVKDNPEWTGNYFMRGDDWERAIHIEYFEVDGNLGFAQNAGVRIHGGKTRQAAQKSLRLYAREEYGEKYFNYQLLPQKEVTSYKRFLLRTTMGSWGDQTIIKDLLAQDISRELNLDHQDFQPVVVYLNGEYWGIHSIRDRIDERFIAYEHNIDKDEVEFQSWSNSDYLNLIGFIDNNDLANHSNYEHVTTKIDIENYIDYTIAEQFFANYDWPVNNIKSWRELPAGKWKWVLYDLDGGLGNEEYNMLEHCSANDPSINWPNPPHATFLFRNLLKNETFQNQFINRYAEILNEDFNIDRMIDRLATIKELYEPEIVNHSLRWNYPSSLSSWNSEVENVLQDFLEKRPCIVRNNIMAFFNNPSFDFSCNPIIDSDKKLIIGANPNNGNFFLLNQENDISQAEISLFDMSGNLVYREGNVSLLKEEVKHFNLSFLTNNTYVLQIVSDGYTAQEKLVILK